MIPVRFDCDNVLEQLSVAISVEEKERKKMDGVIREREGEGERRKLTWVRTCPVTELAIPSSGHFLMTSPVVLGGSN